ncbi:MAG: hypothetical protein JW953_15745 [Anaerolineae bacterium]|nr:hypothetical protein [Anaerolineae bacterium]
MIPQIRKTRNLNSALSSLLSLLLLLLLLFALPLTAYAQEPAPSTPERNGVLTGQVINGTTGQPQGDLEVTLHGIQNNVEVLVITAQAGSQGRYTFENLPTDHNIFYVLEGQYQNIRYLSDGPGVFTPSSTETTLDLQVYETTPSAEAISIGQMHYILTFIPAAVNVAQIFVVNNQGDRTYTGQNGQTFTFALPDNATNILFQEDSPGARFSKTSDGYADTAPIPPGTGNFTVIARYDLPFTDDALTIKVPIPAAVAALNVLLHQQGATLTSKQLQFIETRQIQGESYALFSGGGLGQGNTLTLQLNNLDYLDLTGVPGASPAAPGSQIDQNLLRWLILGLGIVAIIVGGVIYPFIRPQLAHPAALDYNDPQARREKLLLTLARLDEAFAAGELDETVYRQARTGYKAELAKTME